jgi:Sec-independent protein secretion pathway component TatC
LPLIVAIIFFWVGWFLSAFVIIPIIIVFIYKRAKQPAEGQSPG